MYINESPESIESHEVLVLLFFIGLQKDEIKFVAWLGFWTKYEILCMLLKEITISEQFPIQAKKFCRIQRVLAE